ncbi:MAG: ribonuclease R [Bacteroidaceae bacterium]|nr:ribonuclease R [Bacteroidaceae bacterium]MBQ7362670.1 ribonuclease R [Bacteroidaceae bacterium]
MAKKGTKVTNRITKKQLLELLIDLFNRYPEEQLDTRNVFDRLGLKSTAVKGLCMQLLDDLVFDGYLVETTAHKYRLAAKSSVICGTFKRNSDGYNLVYPEDEGEPIVIPERKSAHALTDDYVRVTLYAHRRGRGREGEIIEIIKRAHDTFVGILRVQKHYAFLVTESRVMPADIFIPRDKLKGGKSGDKAVVKLMEWPAESRNPIGCVVDVLGRAGNNDAEMNAILAEYDLPYIYPQAVEAAANKLLTDITKEEIARREDFRDVLTFTIDPEDAKDFDDALSLRPISEGLWEVGVHIADVSHYVTEGSIIDKEAFKRATSIYLVDRTVPMLPERLCNFLCSLRPDEEKLTYSVIFTINDKAEVKKSRIVRSIIRSKRRFSYEEVQEILTSGKGEYIEALTVLNRLAQTMREKRFASGAIDFQQAEVRFRLDEDGKPLSVYFTESNESHQLIEEFMLLANRTVAETIGKKTAHNTPKTFVYRIHDQPDLDKLATLSRFVSKLGYKMRGTGRGNTASSLNSLLKDIKGQKEQNVIETISLRTMQKAKYSTQNIGHFGLAFRYYTHFTSPIRRYPDLMVHRLLDRYLNQGSRSVNAAKYESLCEHCSAQEQVAANAERASIKYKQVEFMTEHIDEEFDAVISGVTEWGIYAEINENKCEGMIPLRTLEDDYYEYDDANYCLVGRRHHRKYTIGDPLRIRIVRANLERKQLDFEIVE